MKTQTPRYAIITPAHNEAAFLPETISSIASQTVKPYRWIIVDDRSTDQTPAILETAARNHAFIHTVRIFGDSERRVGGNVVNVFNRGVEELDQFPDYVVKMDADITLEPSYFESLLHEFEKDPGLGMASGKTYIQHKGNWMLERIPDMHVTGACKTYRKECFQDINGLIPLLGWDILDCSKARMKGWKTRSFMWLHIRHMRMTGSALGMARGRIRTGRVMYTIRSNPVFVLGKSIYRATERPYLAALLIPVGYAMSLFSRPPRLEDKDLAAHLRKEQTGRLMGRQFSSEALFSHKMED